MSISPSQALHASESEQLLTLSVSNTVEVDKAAPTQSSTLFENPFHIEDLMVFDDTTMQRMFSSDGFGVTVADIAWSMHHAPKPLATRIRHNMPFQQRSYFVNELCRPLAQDEVVAASRRVLDGLFWELTYWKTPDLYEELTEGEQLHPGIFQQLEPDIRGKTVLDAGAGSGRASFECLRYGANLVYAVEPSPGLLHILEQKLVKQPSNSSMITYRGRFDQIPLVDGSVDVVVSCSAFTARPEQGGELGLAELKRVAKRGGKIVLIWPRPEDYAWLAEHGFQYVALPMYQEMRVRFRSLHSALRCARHFYAHNSAVSSYILTHRQPEVPFSVLGFNPPRDYCWLIVK